MSKLNLKNQDNKSSIKRDDVCMLCNSKALEIVYYSNSVWKVNRCSSCSFAWVVDIVERSHNTSFSWNQEIVNESSLRNNMYIDRLNRVKCLHPNPFNWLDVGCGGGGMLNCVKNNGFKAEGIELSPSADTISKLYDIQVHRNVLKDTISALSQDKYGVISYFHVIEHIEDPINELMIVRELLSDDGLLVIEVPYFDSFFWKIFKHHHRHFYRSHLNYFNLNSMTTMLSGCGFNILNIDSVPYSMSIGWILKRLGLSYFSSLLSSKMLNKTVNINSGEYLFVIANKK